MGSLYITSDLEAYTRRIRAYPLLSAEEEFELARQYRQGDLEAGQKIVTSNLRFVLKQSQSYFHMGYSPLEIIQEGNMGLVKAVTRFDPEREVRFICYAIWWIKAYIKNFIHKSYQVHTGRLTHAKSLISLDCIMSSDGENDETLLDHLMCDRPDQEETYAGKERYSYLLNLLESDPPVLSQREAFIIRQRFFTDPPATLKDISQVIGVTRERVRQIEARSLARLRMILEKRRSILNDDIDIGSRYVMKRRQLTMS